MVPPVNHEIWSAWWPRLNMLRISSSKQVRERFYVLANSAVLVLCGHFERKLYTPYIRSIPCSQGAIHWTKISGNFGLTEWVGSVQPEKFPTNQSTFGGGPLSVLDRSDRNGPFHLTILTHSQFEDLALRYLPCTKWREILITALLWIVNSGSIGVVRTSMYSYDRSVAASQAKCMFWRLLTIYFPKEFARFFSSFDSKTSNVVFEVTWQISGNGLLKITRYTG